MNMDFLKKMIKFPKKTKVKINGEQVIQEMFGTQKKAKAFYEKIQRDYLTEKMVDYIDKQQMAFISTSDAEGNCNASFRKGGKGFVRVLDEKTIIYPEYTGNGVFANIGNIYENPKISLMFIDFLETQLGLHINGSADIVKNEDMCLMLGIDEERKTKLLEEENNKSIMWIKITVEEAYLHCSKHIPHMMLKEEDSPDKKLGNYFRD